MITIYAKHRKDLRATGKRAKGENWRKHVEKATIDTAVFKLMKWTKHEANLDPPSPGVNEALWLTEPRERAENVQDKAMSRFIASHDLSSRDADQIETIPWNTSLSLEEVIRRTIDTGDRAPGPDKVTFRLLIACCSRIRELVRDMIQTCSQYTYFLNVFREAEVVFIPKAGQDLCTPKS